MFSWRIIRRRRDISSLLKIFRICCFRKPGSDRNIELIQVCLEIPVLLLLDVDGRRPSWTGHWSAVPASDLQTSHWSTPQVHPHRHWSESRMCPTSCPLIGWRPGVAAGVLHPRPSDQTLSGSHLDASAQTL